MGGSAALEVLLHGGHGFVEHLQLVGIEARRVGDLRAQGAHRISGIADGELLHEEGRQLLGRSRLPTRCPTSARQRRPEARGDASVTSRAEEARRILGQHVEHALGDRGVRLLVPLRLRERVGMQERQVGAARGQRQQLTFETTAV